MLRPLIGVLLTWCVLVAAVFAWTRMLTKAHADAPDSASSAAEPELFVEFDPFAEPHAARRAKTQRARPSLQRSVSITFSSENTDRNNRLADYTKLAARMAERWSDEELDRKTNELTTELEAQDTAAQEELDAVIESLKSVLEKHAGTPAAERSRRALEAIESDRQDADVGDDVTVDLF